VTGPVGNPLWRYAGVEPQRHGGVPQVVRPSGEWGSYLLGGQRHARPYVLSPSGPPHAPRNSRPSGVVPNSATWCRNSATSSGAAGTARVSLFARCLSWRESRFDPSSVQAVPAHGALPDNNNSPHPLSGRVQSVLCSSTTSSGRMARAFQDHECGVGSGLRSGHSGVSRGVMGTKPL
jgi:hypothetical protein